MHNNKLISKILFSLVSLVLFSSQCSSEDSNVGGVDQPDLSPVMFDYVCTNGDPVVGKTDIENTERCDTCEIGFKKQDDETCKVFGYSGDGDEEGPPATPQNFTARASNQQVTLSWTVEEGVSYTLFRSTDSNFVIGNETEISDNATSPYEDRNLTNGQTYYYRLRASFSGNTSEPTDAVSATPSLRAPQNFTARASNQQVTLSWTVEEGVSYTLFRSTDSNFVTSNETEISDNATSPYEDRNLMNGQTYYYRLRASFSGNTSEPTDEVSATPFLRAPQNFMAIAVNQRVTLTWTLKEGVSYTLFRSTVQGFDVNEMNSNTVRKFSNQTTSLYHDRRLMNDTTYYYRLRASFSGDTSEPTDEVSATPSLRAPQNLTARAFHQRVTLTWTVGEAIKGDVPVTYTLFRSTTPNFMIEDGDVISDDVTSPYDVENLTNGTTYYFRLTANSVSATNELIVSEPTDEVLATPSLTPKNFTARAFHQRVTLTWTADENVTYTLFRSTVSNFMTSDGTEISDNAASPYHDESLTNGETYYYRLTASFSGDTSEPTEEVSATPLLRTPQNFTAAAFSGQVTLSWAKETGVTYKLFQSTSAGFALESGIEISGVTPPHTLTMLMDNTTYYYRLTANSVSAASAPTDEVSATPQTQISAGGRHTCAVVEGRALCWGRGKEGQLGGGNSNGANTPQQVRGLTTGVAQISTGDKHTCAVVNERALCWGRGYFGELGHNEPSGNGNLRDGVANKTAPTQVYGLTSGVTQISVGDFHTCALVNGGARCWGSSFFGQLGNGQIAGHAQSDAVVPQQVMGLTSGVTQISAGRKHTCAVVEGRAFCWGQGVSGQLGNNGDLDVSTPQQVMGLTSGVTQISAGDSHTCAVMNGAAWCWGEGVFLQLGNNIKEHALIPKRVTGLTSGVTQISAGGKHTCAVVEGRALCWGEGGDGRLGHNEMGNGEADKSWPTQTMGLTSGVTQISAGGRHTCALVNGSVQCWGEGGSGQLANPVILTLTGGSTEIELNDSLFPLPVSGL